MQQNNLHEAWNTARDAIVPSPENMDLQELLYVITEEAWKLLKKIFGKSLDLPPPSETSVTAAGIIIISAALLIILFFLYRLFGARIKEMIRVIKRGNKLTSHAQLTEYLTLKNYTLALRYLVRMVSESSGKTAATFAEIFSRTRFGKADCLTEKYGRIMHTGTEADEIDFLENKEMAEQRYPSITAGLGRRAK